MNKEEKYYLKCIKFFIDEDFVVFGNIITPKRFLPICFKHLIIDKFIFKLDMDSWKELYIHRGIILILLKQHLEETGAEE